jgi:hypothetical protein
MWNFDGSYQAEGQRRAELYAEAELLRAARGGQVEERLLVRLGRLLERLGAQIQGGAQPASRAAERP